MKLNVLLCDAFPGLLPANIPSYEWMFISLFDKVRSDMTYKVYEVFKGELPAEMSDSEVYLITGSNVSAYDDIPWVKQLKEWIVKAAKKEVKLLGVCFGHQMIAEALGGKVEKSTKGWGVGIRESNIVDDEMISSFPNAKMRLLYNHHDQVVKLPKKATLVATSEFCENDAYRIGKNILCFQGHPEFTEEYEAHLLKDFPEDGESAEVKEKALMTMTKDEPQNALVANVMLSFLS